MSEFTPSTLQKPPPRSVIVPPGPTIIPYAGLRLSTRAEVAPPPHSKTSGGSSPGLNPIDSPDREQLNLDFLQFELVLKLVLLQ